MRLQELNDVLLSLDCDSKTFTLDALEKITNGKLPMSAKKHSASFFSNSSQNSYSIVWLSAGYKAKYSKRDNSVTFSKGGDAVNAKNNVPKKDKKIAIRNCVILNKSFIGEWLNKEENNIAHEIINFFKADDGNVYIYNAPYGENVADSENLDIKYVYLTTSKPNSVYFLEYCIEIEKSLHHISISRAEQSDNRDKRIVREKIKQGLLQIEQNLGKNHKAVTYDRTPVENLFEDTIDVLPFTYLAKKIYKAKMPIPVDEKAEGMDYNFARNFGYVLEDEETNTYKLLINKGPGKSPNDWEAIELDKFKAIDPLKSKNKKILDSINQNLFLDMVDNFKMEECYTKVIYKLMECNHNFVNYLISEAMDIKNNEHFIPDDEVVVVKGRMDIFAKSPKTILILENKIDSNITIDKQGVSQLKRYYDWATTDPEIKKLKKLYLLIAPDYRLNAVKAEVEHLRKKEKFKKYIVTGYSTVHNAITNFRNIGGFANFKYSKYLDDIDLLFLRMSLERKDLYTAKISKRIIAINNQSKNNSLKTKPRTTKKKKGQ